MRRRIRAAALGYLSPVLFRVAVVAVVGVGAALAFGPPVGAQQAAPSDAAASTETQADGFTMDLWTGLMSPFCPGRLLIDCPSSQADAMRLRIAKEEAAGRSRDEVVADLYAEYGEIIWQAPRAEGFGLAAYVIPLIAAVVGMGLVMTFLRRQRAAGARVSRAKPKGPAKSAKPPAIDPEMDRRIDAEMKEFGA